MAEVKVTKVEKLDMIIAIVNASDSEDKVMLVEQLETIKTQEINKAAKAKERAAAKKAEGDELRAEVQAILTEEFQSAQAITDAIGKEDVTKAKNWLKEHHSYLWSPISPDTAKWQLAHPERKDVSINRWEEIAGKRGSNYQTLMEMNND